MVTHTKLRNGEWGLRGPFHEVSTGCTVSVHRRDGQVRRETVGRVVWSDGVLAIAATERSEPRFAPPPPAPAPAAELAPATEPAPAPAEEVPFGF